MGKRKPFLVVAILSGLALAACGGTASPSASHAGSTTTSQPRTPRTAKPLTTTTTTPPAPAPPSTTPAAGCFPRTEKGACYTVGDACRSVDHGRSGQAADGAPIVCKQENGWRWEQA